MFCFSLFPPLASCNSLSHFLYHNIEVQNDSQVLTEGKFIGELIYSVVINGEHYFRGDGEPGVFGSLEPEPFVEKKLGAGAAWKKSQELEPEPLKISRLLSSARR